MQCSFGAFIHFVKDKNRTRRPPQNYLHAIVGLTIIVLALVNVHSGYDMEWPTFSGRPPVPEAVGIVFYVWTVVRCGETSFLTLANLAFQLIILAYAAGLFMLRRQFAMEQAQQNKVQ